MVSKMQKLCIWAEMYQNDGLRAIYPYISIYIYIYIYIYTHIYTHIHTKIPTHKKKNTSPIKKGGGGKKIKEFSEQK